MAARRMEAMADDLIAELAAMAGVTMEDEAVDAAAIRDEEDGA